MLARVVTLALDGVAAHRVWVEADIRQGLPAFTVVGLADKAVREARERVRAALVNSGFEFPLKRITVNLAPASVRKIGPGFDLPLALALLVASDQLEPSALEGCAAVGELSLTGEVRGVRGVLAAAEAARAHGLRRLLVPESRAHEAALVPELEVVPIADLPQAVAVVRGAEPVPPLPPAPARPAGGDAARLDLADVRGHAALVVLLEVAAAGGHNVFLHGPPGTGKTMLARRLPGILPPLSREEALEVTRIASVAGRHDGGGLVTERPFRAPHHTVSAAGLVGGANPPLPGEATLAHHGVLFLDELSEFNRAALEALRTPLEDGWVNIVRGQRTIAFPTRCMLVAASNPCPCGLEGTRCRCTAADLTRHARRLSGPLLDRMDLAAVVRRPSAEALRSDPGQPSARIRERVSEARERQRRRYAGTGVACNAQLTPAVLREHAEVRPEALDALDRVYDSHGLSARGHARVLRVARTVADLEPAEAVHARHVASATALRMDRPEALGPEPSPRPELEAQAA